MKHSLIAVLALSGLSLSNMVSAAEVDVQLLQSGQIDLAADTITVPLQHGRLSDGRDVWYVLLDSSDQATAKAQGLVYAPALDNAKTLGAVRRATRDRNGELVFASGAVDFSPARALVPGAAPDFFPPRSVSPGSVGDADYSPYASAQGESGVYNAPIIAFGVGASALEYCESGSTIDHTVIHDKVVSICPEKKQVTLALSHGFASGRSLIYVSLDASDPVPATMEAATYAPRLAKLKGTAATLPLFAVANGETGGANPNRQGFDSALLGDGSALNVLTGIPTLSSAPYSPLWELRIAQWSAAAVADGERMVLMSSQQFQSDVQAGLLTGFGGGALVSSGLLVNCPAIAILK